MIEVVESIFSHAYDLNLHLREKDRQEILAFGMPVRRSVYNCYRKACYRKTALIDGNVAAMWGVAGTPLSLVGTPYLLTGDLVTKVSPLVFVRIYKQEVSEMLSLFPRLENYVHADYEEAIKLLKISGFSITDPIQVGDNMFYKFSIGQ